jgi:hypothetical protein
MKFIKRMGPDPHRPNGKGKPTRRTPNASGCPDIWELDNGDFAVIGRRETATLSPVLPATAGCGHDEEIVVVPRSILLDALPDLIRLEAV